MNKKIVFLVVVLECILAIFIVSVFGHAIESSRDQVLCKDIYFVTADGEKIEDDMIEYTLEGSVISYQLYWVMETSETSNKEVMFESSDPENVKVSPLGKVTFLKQVDVVITIKAVDGSERMDSITLVPKRGGGIIEDMQ